MNKLILSLMLCLSFTATADMQFNNISAKDMENLTSDLTANFAFSSLAGTEPLGHVFGFEIGALMGMSASSRIDDLAKAVSASNSVSNLPNAQLLGRFSVPFGITGELGMFPKISASGASLSSNSFALAWSMTGSVLPSWLVDVGLKLHYTDAKFSLSQTSPTTTTMEFSDKITGYQLFVSKNLIFMEPYIGFGGVSGAGTLDLTGTNIFAPSFTTSSSASTTVSGTHLAVGSEFKLGFFKLGLEYASLMGTTRYSGKMAFYF